MFSAIWYHFYNLKNVKNTHGGMLLLVKMQAFGVEHEWFEEGMGIHLHKI